MQRLTVYCKTETLHESLSIYFGKYPNDLRMCVPIQFDSDFKLEGDEAHNVLNENRCYLSSVLNPIQFLCVMTMDESFYQSKELDELLGTKSVLTVEYTSECDQ